jgi:acetyl coenzyme A synthetase (ADP forming)-like protein
MITPVRPRYLPPPYQDTAESGRLILRDGTTAQIRLALTDDLEGMRAFFERLSPESRRRRFFSSAPPRHKLLSTLCDNSNPRSGLTLVVTRVHETKSRLVATGSYLAKDDKSAEVAFAVDDTLQGLGLGTLLLERLALLAVRNGITRFWAVTHADNKAMRDVFRDSGFTVRERLEGSEIELDFAVLPSEASVARLEMRDRIATAASLHPFFHPKSVAVVGASQDPSSIGYRILERLLIDRFQGTVYPVNPRAAVVGCIRAYPSVRNLPEAVDLAVISVPRDAVLGVVDDCAVRGVRALLVITAGFAEANAEGRELQRILVDKVRGYGMRLVGPNCMGLLNTDGSVRLNASFSPVFPPPGQVAMSSQSGALGLAILAAAKRMGLGLSTFVSVGNKADVSGNDLLQYWEEDAGTNVILLYLESFGNPRRFARIARRVSLRKPIVAIKSGRTKAGGRAAGSHTAALAASELAVDALFHQTGVIRAETLEEMFDLAAALGSQPLPRGRRVAIVTNAGGPSILCADVCEAGGLAIPELSDLTKSKLSALLPPSASVTNPVDMIASATPEQYARIIEVILASGEIDALIIIYIPVGLCETEAVVAALRAGVVQARAAGTEGKPVLACLMAEQDVRTQLNVGDERIPSYAFPEAAARVLVKSTAYAEWRNQPEGFIPEFEDLDLPSARQVCRQALAQYGAGWLSAEETRAVLRAVRLPMAEGAVAKTVDEAVEAARRIGFPVAVKLASRQVIHKTEAGGVCLNLADTSAVHRAFESIRDQMSRSNQLEAMEGVVVQHMITEGVEVMAGVTLDPLFGPLIAFGLGGVYVEVLADICFRVTPLTDCDAAEMVRAIRGYRLLQGYRGHPPGDLEAIQEMLLRLSRLVEELPEISEVDLNPVFVLPPGRGCQIADTRVRVQTLRNPSIP